MDGGTQWQGKRSSRHAESGPRQEDAKAAKEKASQIIQKLKMMRLAKAAEIVENGIDETLSYYSLPAEHWRCLRTNYQQSPGKTDAGDPPTNTGGGRLSRWPVRSDVGSCTPTTCRCYQVGDQAVLADEPSG
jgi:hypothetical protein